MGVLYLGPFGFSWGEWFMWMLGAIVGCSLWAGSESPYRWFWGRGEVARRSMHMGISHGATRSSAFGARLLIKELKKSRFGLQSSRKSAGA